ncbi:MAG: DUF465 domain-containing protein [Bdellovibrionales bacterium]|nr:DUF465 domain-containing protein [Bdellovibrionales bacterium]
MDTEHPDLAHEFPEFQTKIHYLKQSDNHFAKLFVEYNDICKAILRAEKRIDLISDLEEETLRKKRLALKDELYAILTK